MCHHSLVVFNDIKHLPQSLHPFLTNDDLSVANRFSNGNVTSWSTDLLAGKS